MKYFNVIYKIWQPSLFYTFPSNLFMYIMKIYCWHIVGNKTVINGFWNTYKHIFDITIYYNIIIPIYDPLILMQLIIKSENDISLKNKKYLRNIEILLLLYI